MLLARTSSILRESSCVNILFWVRMPGGFRIVIVEYFFQFFVSFQFLHYSFIYLISPAGFCGEIQPRFVVGDATVWRHSPMCFAQFCSHQHDTLQTEPDRSEPVAICPRSHEHAGLGSFLSRLLGSQSSGILKTFRLR